MKSLITVTDREEAEEIIDSECDILDIKNPSEGSLGANFPWVIKKIEERIGEDKETSVAIGDVPYLPGTVSLAVNSAARFSPDYIKVGLMGANTQEKAIDLLKKCRKSINMVDSDINLVAAAYADHDKVDSLNPMELPEVGEEAGADLLMIDTATKESGDLLNYMDEEDLKDFVSSSHERGLETALAGSLSKEDVDKVKDIGADIFGVRGAVCGEDSRESFISEEKVEELLDQF